MKSISPYGVGHGGKELTFDQGTHQGRMVRPSKGQNPKSAMIDGPFGGKVKA